MDREETNLTTDVLASAFLVFKHAARFLDTETVKVLEARVCGLEVRMAGPPEEDGEAIIDLINEVLICIETAMDGVNNAFQSLERARLALVRERTVIETEH